MVYRHPDHCLKCEARHLVLDLRVWLQAGYRANEPQGRPGSSDTGPGYRESNPKRFGMRSRTIASSFRTPSCRSAAFDKSKIGHQALVDPICVDDDPALGSLSEDLGQARDRFGT